MSSHREAPEISQDPVADNTDFYAFVSPDKPNTVTLIANFIPLEPPAGGPNFYEFGDDVLYAINIDNDGDGLAEITYHFRFSTQLRNPNTFLYNTGQITSLTSSTWNKRQFYTVTKIANGTTTTLATNRASPPCNIGPRSCPNYAALAHQAVHTLASGETVFAGQRADGFYVDLGSVFDLLDLRPFQNLHLIPTTAAPGVNALKSVNVHSIALQVPIAQLTANGSVPTSVTDPNAVLGAWATASRQKSKVYDQAHGKQVNVGPFVQVSRLGHPLINEVIIPLGKKDYWNSEAPQPDSQFVQHYNQPEVAGLLPALYPGSFPNLAALTAPRADLVAILLTGIPSGLIAGFQNYTGPTLADHLRLNLAIPPTTSDPSHLGILGGDFAGYPNGRRVFDDVVAIVLRAIAGVIYPLIDPTFAPDPAALAAADLTSYSFLSPEQYQPSFPYLGKPYSAPLRSSPTPATYTGIARPENARPSSAHFGQKRPEPVQARR
jgi:Domain of unknown function (DUF4331)